MSPLWPLFLSQLSQSGCKAPFQHVVLHYAFLFLWLRHPGGGLRSPQERSVSSGLTHSHSPLEPGDLILLHWGSPLLSWHLCSDMCRQFISNRFLSTTHWTPSTSLKLNFVSQSSYISFGDKEAALSRTHCFSHKTKAHITIPQRIATANL